MIYINFKLPENFRGTSEEAIGLASKILNVNINHSVINNEKVDNGRKTPTIALTIKEEELDTILSILGRLQSLATLFNQKCVAVKVESPTVMLKALIGSGAFMCGHFDDKRG